MRKNACSARNSGWSWLPISDIQHTASRRIECDDGRKQLWVEISREQRLQATHTGPDDDHATRVKSQARQAHVDKRWYAQLVTNLPRCAVGERSRRGALTLKAGDDKPETRWRLPKRLVTVSAARGTMQRDHEWQSLVRMRLGIPRRIGDVQLSEITIPCAVRRFDDDDVSLRWSLSHRNITYECCRHCHDRSDQTGHNAKRSWSLAVQHG